jgi:hypothetical protein
MGPDVQEGGGWETEEDIQGDFNNWVWNQLDAGFWKKKGEAT